MRPTNTSVNYCIKYEKVHHLTVNGSLKYSTDEIVVGEWIDGKPIYRKLIEVGTIAKGGNKTVQYGVNVERVIRLEFSFTGENAPIFQPAHISDAYDLQLTDWRNNRVTVSAPSGWPSGISDCFMILEYIKDSTA